MWAWHLWRLRKTHNLKPTTTTNPLRLPEALLDRINVEANKQDMPYQSLIKAWLAQDIEEHRSA